MSVACKYSFRMQEAVELGYYRLRRYLMHGLRPGRDETM
jgi:hypothetical protein